MAIKNKKQVESYVLVELDELLWVIKFIGRWGRANYMKCRHYYQDITEDEVDSLIADFPSRRWQDTGEGYHMFCLSLDEKVQQIQKEREKAKIDSRIYLGALEMLFGAGYTNPRW